MKIWLTGKNANNNFAIVDKDDFKKVKKYKWWSHGKTGYAYTKINRKSVLMHRFILNASPGILIDHKDENRLNNRRNNLRLCTATQNLLYRKKNKTNKSGYKGVVFESRSKRNPWVIHYSHQKKQYNGGAYPTKEIAALAYNKIIKELHGKFAYLNKVSSKTE